MSVVLDSSKCIGCGRCREVCPGNLIKTDEEGKAFLRKPGDCWSCVSCVKECPVSAISLVLESEMDGRGARLTASRNDKKILWTVERGKERIKTLVTDAREANKY